MSLCKWPDKPHRLDTLVLQGLRCVGVEALLSQCDPRSLRHLRLCLEAADVDDDACARLGARLQRHTHLQGVVLGLSDNRVGLGGLAHLLAGLAGANRLRILVLRADTNDLHASAGLADALQPLRHLTRLEHLHLDVSHNPCLGTPEVHTLCRLLLDALPRSAHALLTARGTVEDTAGRDALRRLASGRVGLVL